MTGILASSQSLSTILGFVLFSCLVAFLWAPTLIHFLYKFRVIKGPKVELAGLARESHKANTPIMGGLLVIVTVAVLTIAFNWSRSFTWAPIGVMLLAAGLGGVDDFLSIYGKERRSRKLSQVLTLIRVHKDFHMRLWYLLTLPWSAFKRLSVWIGSRTSRGVHVHEKLILQFIAGAITAWWIFYKLGEAWHYLYVPFFGSIFLGWLIIPIVIFIVMYTANAVNIADGMDGLAGGMLIPAFASLMFLSWANGFGEIAIINAVTVGALLAYTYFNIKPARFMMGDVGSLGLGALLAINSIAIGELVPLIFIGFVFYVEATSVLIQVAGRYTLRRRIFRMAPIHHHFELIGWSEEKTIMRFWIVNVAFVILGTWLALQ